MSSDKKENENMQPPQTNMDVTDMAEQDVSIKKQLQLTDKEQKGLYSLIALLFNCLCWIIVIIITFPWNVIWLICCCAKCDQSNEQKTLNCCSYSIKITENEGFKCKEPCSLFLRLLHRQYEFWFGFGIIINCFIVWISFFILVPDDQETLSISWQVGIFSFALIFGALMIYEGMLEEFYSDQARYNFERNLIGEIYVTDDKKKLSTKGILFHYVVVAAIVGLTAGYITQQIWEVAVKHEDVTFDHIYAWFSICLTNIIVGYTALVPITRFMFRYYPHNLEPKDQELRYLGAQKSYGSNDSKLINHDDEDDEDDDEDEMSD